MIQPAIFSIKNRASTQRVRPGANSIWDFPALLFGIILNQDIRFAEGLLKAGHTALII